MRSGDLRYVEHADAIAYLDAELLEIRSIPDLTVIEQKLASRLNTTRQRIVDLLGP